MTDPELIKIIHNLGTAFEDFHADYDKRLDIIETAVAKGGFPGGGSSGKDKTAAAKDHAKGFYAWARSGRDVDGLKALEVKAALSTDNDPAGGFMVPEELEGTIDRVAMTASAMRRIANIKRITTDTYKKLVSQGGTGSGWVGEKESRSETDTPELAEIAINAKELYAMPATTQALLDDSAFDVGSWLQEEIGTVFTEQEGDAFINGDGVSKPKGIAAYSMAANASYAWGKVGYIVSGHATLLNNADKLFDLLHALKPVYRTGAAFLMNDTTLSVIRKFKDGEGNYLWRPGLAQGAPDTFLGYPVEIDDNIDDIGANKYPVFFGNFKRGYTIVDRLGIRVLRDPFTDKPNVLFYCTKRVGGGITLYEAIKALKIST